MAKRTHQASSMNRKQLSRHAKEQRLRRILTIGTGVILTLVVLILAWGAYDQYVLKPRRPVATVNGVQIPLAEYQKLVQYRRWDYRNYLNQLQSQRQQMAASQEDTSFLVQYLDQQIQQVQRELMSLSMTALDNLIDDQITRQEAALRGISVSPMEVTEEIEQQFGYERNPPTPAPITPSAPITVTPTPTPAPMTEIEYTEQADYWFTAMEESSGFTRADYERLVEGSMLREQLEEQLAANAPTTSEQAKARHILVATAEEAQAVLARLNAGEAFEDLAAEVSLDDSNKDQGGDLGWFGRGRMVPEFEEAAFSLQPGELSDIIETQFGFHILQVEDYDPAREMDASEAEQARQDAINAWYEAKRTSEGIVRSWDSTMVPEDNLTQ